MNTNATTSFARKIGNTTYTVKVCCDEAARETFEDKLIRLIKKGNANFFQVYRKNKLQFEIPVTVLILLVAFCFWVAVPLLVIGLFTDFRYSFRGPDLGKENINDAMNKASEFAENIKRDNDDEKDEA